MSHRTPVPTWTEPIIRGRIPRRCFDLALGCLFNFRGNGTAWLFHALCNLGHEWARNTDHGGKRCLRGFGVAEV